MLEKKEIKNGLSQSQSKTERQSPPNPFPVVGLGASAGGFEALKAFFTKVKGSILKKDKSFPYRILLQFIAEQFPTKT